MRYDLGILTVYTEKMQEELDQMTTEPTKLSYQKSKVEEFKLVKKVRNFTIFTRLVCQDSDKKFYRVISDIFDLIDFVEILKAYSGKRLNRENVYHLKKFDAKIITRHGKDEKLRITFTNFSNSLKLDKFECSSLAAKLTKILQRCEAWQEQEA